MATKAEMCLEIYKELQAAHGDNHKAIRGEFIRRAVAEASCTPAGAATYYANCKNRGGATGETRVRVAGGNSSPIGVDHGDKPDMRMLYSAVQRDKNGLVAHVAAFYNPTDAANRAVKVRGYAVLGAPDIGEEISTLTGFAHSSIEDGLLDHNKTFDISLAVK